MAANPVDLLTAFAHTMGLALPPEATAQLTTYAACVWEKKNFLNLTSVSSQTEIFNRHLADGLVAAAHIQKLCSPAHTQPVSVADVGSGAGYIGLTIAALLPHAQVTLVESLEKRCAFLNWAVLQTGFKNVKIKKARLGQGTRDTYDFVTERAMGQLPAILDICLAAVKSTGYFLAFQGENPYAKSSNGTARLYGVFPYDLPTKDNQKRHLIIFEKK